MRDMAVEWKSYGSLVGSFNLIVYGNLIYLSEKISFDDSVIITINGRNHLLSKKIAENIFVEELRS